MDHNDGLFRHTHTLAAFLCTDVSGCERSKRMIDIIDETNESTLDIPLLFYLLDIKNDIDLTPKIQESEPIIFTLISIIDGSGSARKYAHRIRKIASIVTTDFMMRKIEY